MELLLIDGNTLSRAGASALLQQLEPTPVVREAVDEHAAVCMLEAHRIDVALLSLADASAERLDMLDRLRTISPTVAFCAIGDKYEPGLARECMEHGALGFIAPSASALQFMTAINVVADGAIYLPSEVRMDWQRDPASELVGRHHPATVGKLEAAAQRPPGTATDALSARQREVLELMIEGAPNKTISRRMAISENTVKAHVAAILRTFGVGNRTAAVTLATRQQMH